MPKTIKLEPYLGSEELENRYRKTKDPVLRSHYQILWLISQGKTTAQAMEVTGYSRGWIQQLARRYNAGGPEVLGDRRHRNPGARDRALLTAEQREELARALTKPPPDGGMWNSRKVGEWIEAKTGRAVSNKKQRGWEYLRRLGNTARRCQGPATARPTKASRRLSKKALDEGDEAQGGLPEGQGGALWCEDEHRLGLKPILLRKVWSPVGERPLVKVHQRYQWSYLYAFARPKSGEVYWLILPTVNAEVFSLALEHYAKEVGAGTRKRILLVLDQAGWHTAKQKLRVPEGIHLEFLPRPTHRSYNRPKGCGCYRTRGWRTATSKRSRNWRRR